jgi:hypothetical protein
VSLGFRVQTRGIPFLVWSWMFSPMAKADKAAQAAEQAEKERKGLHCLIGWDGSHPIVMAFVQKQMRDPDSFEHTETRVTPVDDKGQHTFVMKYRARNGFGGMTVGTALATYSNSDCEAKLLSIE